MGHTFLNPLKTTHLETTLSEVLGKCPPGTVFLAAVSGGADSVAMLVALAAIRDHFPNYQLYCIHIEHGIRPEQESRGDAELVRSLCEKLNIPCRIISIAPGKIAAYAKRSGLGIEAAARQYRRRAWFREARRLEASGSGPVRIVTAHTRDDMLETALMRILRGAGPVGLAAMPVSRGRILRPLLSVSRGDVLEYLTANNIPWREDSTNADIHFFRNRVRHCLIPPLNESFPGWKGALAALAETQSLAAAFIRDEAARRIEWVSPSTNYQLLTTNYQLFLAQPAIVREEALFQGIDTLAAKLPSAPLRHSTVKRANIRHFCKGNITAIDLGPFQLKKDSHQITIFPTPYSPLPTPCSESGFSLLIKAPGLYTLKRVTIEVRPCCESVTEDEVGFCALLPLVLRRGYNDDRVTARGREIALSKLKKGGERIISALDRLGVAAFIGSGGLLLCRDDEAPLPESGEKMRCVVK